MMGKYKLPYIIENIPFQNAFCLDLVVVVIVLTFTCQRKSDPQDPTRSGQLWRQKSRRATVKGKKLYIKYE